jgi:hypothetical protein
MAIGDPWRDVNLEAEAVRIGRECGHIAPSHTFCSGDDFPLFEDFSEFALPRSEWKAAYDYAMEIGGPQTWLTPMILDQNGFGTCTSFACSMSIMVQWVRQFGKEHAIQVAPPSLYPHCASSGNSGSSVSCITRRAMERGVLLTDTAANREILSKIGLDPNHVIDGVQWNAGTRCPSSWYDATAKHIKIVEAYSISSVEQMFSAVLQGFTLVYGRSGHAICGIWLIPEGNSWVLIYVNSWGPWGATLHGLRGFGEDSESYLNRTGAARGCVAVRTISVPEDALELLTSA